MIAVGVVVWGEAVERLDGLYQPQHVGECPYPRRNHHILAAAAEARIVQISTLAGPNTQIDRINQMAIYPEGKLLVVAMPGVQGEMEPPRVFVGMWSLDDDGDVAPKWTLTGKQTGLKKPFAVALNPEHKELYVTDMRLNGVMTFSVPEIFQH